MANQMRQWQMDKPGVVAENLRLVSDAPRPAAENLRHGEILIQTTAASINPADYKVPQLGLAARALISFPKVLGMDISGTVVATGKDVTEVEAGDEVIGRIDPMSSTGSLSEYVVLHEDTWAKCETGNREKLEAAAGAGTAALTAYQTIQPYVKSGDHVFINGGSGGTGTFGIQIAKLLGCKVTATCSTSKASLVKELGADDIIDYTKSDVKAALRERGPIFDHAVDNVGSSPRFLHSASSTFLKPGAQFVIVGGSASVANMTNTTSAILRPSWLGGGKHKAKMYLTYKDREATRRIADWVAKGELRTVVEKTFEFGQAREAYGLLTKGSVAGKLIVRVKEE